MSHFLPKLKKAPITFTFYLNKLCIPHPKYFPDKILYDTEHNRNKALLAVQLLAFFGFIINILINNGTLQSNIHGLIAATLVASTLFLSCHLTWHPQIFKLIYNIYIFLFGMLLIRYGDHGVLGAWIAVPFFPLLVYFITGSFLHFLLHATFQTLFLNTLYQSLIRKSLAYLSIEECVKAMTYYTHQNLQYAFLFTALIHYTTNTAVYKANAAEKQKDNFEKQKNFLLGFSHELRNLINSLMGNVKLAFLEKPSDKIKDFLFNAEVCGELLLHLVNNILDTGKAEIGDLEINTAPRRIYDTMERIWGICSELIKRKNLQGRMKISKDIPEILVVDHYRITQIMMNLVGNAVKYTDAGVIDISVEWIPETEAVHEKCFQPYPFNDNDDHEEGIFEKNQAMSVFDTSFTFLTFSNRKIDRNMLNTKAEQKKGILKISITDSGCGILREDLTKIFERFTQGTTDPSKSKLGTGLGLFITKELCRRMNGDIRVFSRRNAGSCFTVCLPLEPVKQERAFFFDLAGIQRIAEHTKLQAMIVDDEQLSQFILKDFLKKLNVDVVDVADNGLMAYQKFQDKIARKEYVNIVTMDLTMPVMDGKAAAQKIRELERAKNLEPCMMIIVSANCSESEIGECLDKNGKIRADAFVKKPVSVDELCRTISSYFGHIYDKQRVRLLTE